MLDWARFSPLKGNGSGSETASKQAKFGRNYSLLAELKNLSGSVMGNDIGMRVAPELLLGPVPEASGNL